MICDHITGEYYTNTFLWIVYETADRTVYKITCTVKEVVGDAALEEGAETSADGQVLTLDASVEWKGTFKDLPAYLDGAGDLIHSADL